MEIILASGSRWRRELLRAAGIPCRAVSPGIDERSVVLQDPIQLACTLAMGKAKAILPLYPEAWVLGADQVAHLAGEVFGKPEDPGDHLRRLRQLRGRVHQLVTGVALLHPGGAEIFHEISHVHFRGDLSDEELQAYVASGEGSDCAGGYQVEGLGGQLIERIEGDWSNVIGLPLYRVIGALRSLGWRPSWRPIEGENG